MILLNWIRPEKVYPATKGHHRFLWDVQYTPVNADVSFPMSAVYQNTAPDQTAPWAMPGEYKVRLTADGQSQEQKFTVKMDPRVQTSTTQLQEQFDLSVICYNARQTAVDALAKISAIDKQISQINANTTENIFVDFKI